MAQQDSDGQGRNELPIVWRKPDDIKTLEKLVSVNKRMFSLQLLQMRFIHMDEPTKHRAIKVMDALRTGYFCRL